MATKPKMAPKQPKGLVYPPGTFINSTINDFDPHATHLSVVVNANNAKTTSMSTPQSMDKGEYWIFTAYDPRTAVTNQASSSRAKNRSKKGDIVTSTPVTNVMPQYPLPCDVLERLQCPSTPSANSIRSPFRKRKTDYAAQSRPAHIINPYHGADPAKAPCDNASMPSQSKSSAVASIMNTASKSDTSPSAPAATTTSSLLTSGAEQAEERRAKWAKLRKDQEKIAKAQKAALWHEKRALKKKATAITRAMAERRKKAAAEGVFYVPEVKPEAEGPDAEGAQKTVDRLRESKDQIQFPDHPIAQEWDPSEFLNRMITSPDAPLPTLENLKLVFKCNSTVGEKRKRGE